MRKYILEATNSKAIVVYKDKDGYGVRPHEYDWREGDRIMSKDGKTMQKILKVVPNCKESINYLKRVFTTVKIYDCKDHKGFIREGGNLIEVTVVLNDGETIDDYVNKCIKHMVSYN